MKDPLWMQKAMRRKLQKENRCPRKGCHFGKKPEAIFCWAHWWDLTAAMRSTLLLARRDKLTKVYNATMKLALAFLEEKNKPLS